MQAISRDNLSLLFEMTFYKRALSSGESLGH